jgi:hypothetical protein
MCMNLQIGGGGGFSGEENQRKWSVAGGKALSEKIKNDPEFSRLFSERSSFTLKSTHSNGKIKYDTFSGKTHSVETKRKIGDANSIRQSGEKNSQFGTNWIIHPTYGTLKIKTNNLAQYLENGWKLGRK